MLARLKNNKALLKNNQFVNLKYKFTSKWKTDNSGVSNDNQITLPLISSGTYNFVVDWGDGSNNTITSYNQSEITHTYAANGEYTINILGIIKGFQFNNGGDKDKIINISDWGSLEFNNNRSFNGCSNLDITANNAPKLSTVDISYMFARCYKLSSINFNHWDTSNITNMESMFNRCYVLNKSINFSTKNVTNMLLMFKQCYAFNQPINFDTSKVTNMGSIFNQCYAFNQPINFDTSKVTNMELMFNRCYQFNQDISSLDIGLVSNMDLMLADTLFDTTNYDKLLISWESQPHLNNVVFGCSAKYTAGSAAETARTNLINNNGWTITDGGSV